MIVADTGAVLALLDADDRHHDRLRTLFRQAPTRWLLPWAVLPEVDHPAHTQVGRRVADMFLADVAAGGVVIEWGTEDDLDRAVAVLDR